MSQWLPACIVNSAGPASDASEAPNPPGLAVYINLTWAGGVVQGVNVSPFTNQWFYSADSCKSEALAVALTAVSLGATVQPILDLPDPANPNAFPQIYRLYINAPGD